MAKEDFEKTWEALPEDRKKVLQSLWERRAAKIGIDLPKRGESLVEYVWELRRLLRAARGKLK